MINILAEVNVEYASKFLEMFSTKGLEMRKLHKSISSQIFKVENESQRLFIMFNWESKDSFLGFLNDQSAKETMTSSGLTHPPIFTFIEKAAEFDG